MSTEIHTKTNPATIYDREALRLEIVTACVGFDDLLDYTLTLNPPMRTSISLSRATTTGARNGPHAGMERGAS